MCVKFVDAAEFNIKRSAYYISEEILCVFPVINLLSSPSKSVKDAATCVLSKMDRFLLDLPVAPGKALISDAIFPSISTPESILFRLLHDLWFKVVFNIFHCDFNSPVYYTFDYLHIEF